MNIFFALALISGVFAVFTALKKISMELSEANKLKRAELVAAGVKLD